MEIRQPCLERYSNKLRCNISTEGNRKTVFSTYLTTECGISIPAGLKQESNQIIHGFMNNLESG